MDTPQQQPPAERQSAQTAQGKKVIRVKRWQLLLGILVLVAIIVILLVAIL